MIFVLSEMQNTNSVVGEKSLNLKLIDTMAVLCMVASMSFLESYGIMVGLKLTVVIDEISLDLLKDSSFFLIIFKSGYSYRLEKESGFQV